MLEKLKNITTTKNGFPVKDLRWLPVDNIIVGLVKDPLYGKQHIHDGFIAVQWTSKGKPIKLNKGRTELIINIEN